MGQERHDYADPDRPPPSPEVIVPVLTILGAVGLVVGLSVLHLWLGGRPWFP